MSEQEILFVLKKTLIDNNIEPSDEIFNKLQTYYQYLIEYNNNINLTSIISFQDVYIKHFCDSIAMCKHYSLNSTLCDIGTGAGFPGMVLKIVRPDLQITLVDSLNKRVDFLNNLIAKLGLTGISALHYRAEDVEFKSIYLNSFDYVVARAVASMPTLTEYCLPFVKVGGEFVAYKSINSKNEVISAKSCIELLGGKYVSTYEFNISDDTLRNLVIIKKIKPTNSKYPRGQNKPRLKPII